MICPQCKADNEDTADSCFTCGRSFATTTTVIRRGSVIASRYEILSPLGKGGMGMVYKAHDRVLDETVALKVLRPDVAREADMARRFRSEIKLARKVRHRNVCGIHEYGEEGDLRYIAMEFIEGVDFRHLLQDRGAPLPEEAFEISIQIAEGLGAIHEAGIIHRDLKTPNIMRDSRGYVRLMDFGIAKQAGVEATLGATAMGMIVGTPEYMSPEQARGEKIDFRSDIYALGIVVFEIFTGHVPFRGETPIATIFKHLQDPPPLEGPRAAALPESLIPVLKKSLAKHANDRYQTVHEMVEALQEARSITFPKARAGPVTSSLRPSGHRPEPAPFATHGTPLPAVAAEATTALPTPVPTSVPTAVRTQVTPPAPRTEVREAPPTEFVRTPVPRPAPPPAKPPEEAERERQEEARRREEAERARREQERAAAMRAAQERVEAHIKKGDAGAARAALVEGREAWGTEPFLTLAVRIQELEQKQRQAAVRQALEEAEREAKAGKLEQAQAAASRALDLDPSDAAAKALSARLAEQLRKQVEEQRRARQVQESLGGIEALLRSGDLARAEASLDQAESSYGREPFVALRRRLEDARRTEDGKRREAAIQQLLAQAEQLAEVQQLEKAREAIAQAQALDPGHKGAQKAAARIAESVKRRAEEQRKAQAVAAAVAAVEALLHRGALADAQAELKKAERAHGPVEGFRALRGRIEEAERQQRRAAEAAAVAEAPTVAQPVLRPPVPRPEPQPVHPPAPRHEPLPVLPPAATAAPTAGGPKVAIMAAGIGVLVIVGALGLWLARGRTEVADLPRPSPTTAPPTDPSKDDVLPSPSPTAGPVVGAGAGLLVIDALPWGEVTEVVDAGGKKQSVGPSPFTPVVLSLPPGQYTVSLKNPNFPRPVSLTAKVPANGTERATAEFGKVDAAEYFKRAGW